MKAKKHLLSVALSGMFLALAYVLPFFTGQIPEIGSMLCPMHIPVLLCGFVCGAPYGLLVGLVAPLLRSLTLGMPPLFPTATAMAFELAVYGLMAGLLYSVLPKKKVFTYASLVGAIVWGIVMFCIMGFDVTKFGLAAFWTGAIVNAIPGIIVQIILIPMVVIALEKAKLMPNKK